MDKKIFIIINNDGISGSEKRIISIWNSLLDKGINIYLVISENNYKKLVANSEFDINNSSKKNIILINPKKNSYFSYFFSILQIRKYITKKSVLHFPLIYSPLFLFFKNIKIITSWNANYKPFLNKKINLSLFFLIWYSFFLSNKIDILDNNNFNFLKKILIFKNKISLNTAGSFSNHNIFKPSNKKNIITFLSRFTEGKGIFELLDCLDSFDNKLSLLSLKNVELHICGNGELKENILKKLENKIYNNFKLKIYYNQNPEHILSQSKVFLSLQKRTNYPSKSLIEAMYSGCIPIIRNTGDSNKMLEDKYAFYIDKKLETEELVDSIIKILLLKNEDFNNISSEIRDITLKRFNIKNSTNYYNTLYNVE